MILKAETCDTPIVGSLRRAAAKILSALTTMMRPSKSLRLARWSLTGRRMVTHVRRNKHKRAPDDLLVIYQFDQPKTPLRTYTEREH
jgi:hypothetical protein